MVGRQWLGLSHPPTERVRGTSWGHTLVASAPETQFPTCCCFRWEGSVPFSPLPSLQTFTPPGTPPTFSEAIIPMRNSLFLKCGQHFCFLEWPWMAHRERSQQGCGLLTRRGPCTRRVSWSFSKPVQPHRGLWASSLCHGEAQASGWVVTACSSRFLPGERCPFVEGSGPLVLALLPPSRANLLVGGGQPLAHLCQWEADRRGHIMSRGNWVSLLPFSLPRLWWGQGAASQVCPGAGSPPGSATRLCPPTLHGSSEILVLPTLTHSSDFIISSERGWEEGGMICPPHQRPG